MQRGNVRYVGVLELGRVADRARRSGSPSALGLARFETLQAYYTLAGRDLERELVPMLHSEGRPHGVEPAGGRPAERQVRARQQGETGSRRTTFDFPPVNRERAYDCIDAMRESPRPNGVSVAQIALAWLLHQRAVTTVIVGAKKVEQLDDNIAATAVELSADELAKLDRGQRAAGRVSGLDAGAPGRGASQAVSRVGTSHDAGALGGRRWRSLFCVRP